VTHLRRGENSAERSAERVDVKDRLAFVSRVSEDENKSVDVHVDAFSNDYKRSELVASIKLKIPSY